MLIHADISCKLPVKDGFGFQVMHAAYKFNVRGKMYYGNTFGIIMSIEAETGDLDLFLNWFKKQTSREVPVDCFRRITPASNFTEFDIYQQ